MDLNANCISWQPKFFWLSTDIIYTDIFTNASRVQNKGWVRCEKHNAGKKFETQVTRQF
jgi:hypothetical protein